MYLIQIFEHRFFHADRTRGICLSSNRSARGRNAQFRVVFGDFGMAGRVPTNVVAGLKELIFGVCSATPTGC